MLFTNHESRQAEFYPDSDNDNEKNSSSKMNLFWAPYDLELRHTFTISGFSRKTTPVVLTKLEYDGLTGYGEASLPPYLGETQASVIEF